MHTNSKEPICLSESASSWWESRSPEKQRAHIKRHPKGKYAKMVKNRQLALKPLNKNASKKAKFRNQAGGGNVADNVGGADAADGSEDGDEEDEEGEADVDDSEEESEAEPKEDLKDADFEDEDENEESQPRPPAIRETRPIPPRSAMADSYRSSLPDALKAGLRAFFSALDSGRSPGTRADLSGSREEINRGDIPAVVKKMKPKTQEDASTMVRAIKATLPIAKIAAYGLIGVGAAAAGAGALPAILACFFINSTLDAASMSRSAAYASLSGDECDRLVETFMDWAEGLNLDAIKKSADGEFTSTSSTGIEVKIRRCPVDYYRGLEEECGRRYLLVVGRKIRGFLMWDKKYGTPSKEANGWYSVLVDGFNENAYRTDRDEATLEPYTAIHRNDIVLVNPARMPYEFAKQWAVSVLRR